MLSETKLDSSFSHAQFSIIVYSKPYRLDRGRNSEGLILFIRERLPSKLLSSKISSGNKEYFLVEINLCKRKWLIISPYHPHNTTIPSYLNDIEKEIDSQSLQYGNNILLGDFNCELKEQTLLTFCGVHNLKKSYKGINFF